MVHSVDLTDGLATLATGKSATSRLSGRARLRRALTGQIELASPIFCDAAVQLNRFVSKGTLDSVILGFLFQENLRNIL